MRKLVTIFIIVCVLATPALAGGVNVVTSIKPVQALVAAVMAGVGSPYLLMDSGASPHTYSLKPSGANALENADIVFWIGPELEVFLSGPLDTLAKSAARVTLIEARNLNTLPLRAGGAFDAHGHEEDEHEAEHEEINTHIWLDPNNAKAMVQEISEALIATDPANASIYTENATRFKVDLTALEAEITAILKPVRDKPFVVFHDAYHYFENRFGMSTAGSVTVSPEVIPGVKRIKQIKEKVEQLEAACVFSEPQFTPKLVSVVTEGTSAKTGVLDPMGSELESGPDLYFDLIRALAHSMRTCLEDQD